MSNIFRQGVLIFLCLFGVDAAAAPTVDRERLESIEDDTPLSRAVEKPAWDYLFGILHDSSETDLKRTAFAEVGFVELSRQPSEYRGRLVSVRGKLLRCQFIPERKESSPFAEPSAEPSKPLGFYESWILLNDEKHVPITVCSTAVPDDMPLGDDLLEKVELTGFFYKRQLFLSAENEEVSAPTILAKTLHWFPDAKKEIERKRSAAWWLDKYFWQIIILLVVVWLTLRTLSRQTERRNRLKFELARNGEAEFDGKIVIPDIENPGKGDRKNSDDSEKQNKSKSPLDASTLGVLFLAVLFVFSSTGLAQELSAIDETFTKMLLRMDDFAWNALGDETIPLAQQQEEVYVMLNELRSAVPLSFLKQGAIPLPMPISLLVDEPKTYRGKAFALQGTAIFVEELPLNPKQQQVFRLPMFFRCRLLVAGHRMELLTPTVPVSWKRNEPIRERIAATGLYLKRLPSGDHEPSPQPQESGDELFDEAKNAMFPLFAAPEIEWYPDTLLGKLGMNVGSLDRIPILRITDLKKKNLEVAEPLRLLDRKEILRRAFKFTETDREPFYGLLHATGNASKGRLGAIAKESLEKSNQTSFSSVPLFTEPDKQRNKLVLLYGTAKRVIPTLVDDKEVQKLYGISKYYQIYFYPNDSQGNPVVACVTELPKGMPVGSGDDYSEQISIAGFFYKLWVYESSAVVDKEGSDGESYKPNFAPLLIGRNPDWYPTQRTLKPPGAVAGDWTTTLSLTTFGGLAVLWYLLRRFRSTKPIVFKLR